MEGDATTMGIPIDQFYITGEWKARISDPCVGEIRALGR